MTTANKTRIGDSLTFKVRPRRIEYGDGRKFWEYTIIMRSNGKLAGVEHGPRRSTPTLAGMWIAAKARVAVLQTHRLYAIEITKECIKRGEGHNCNTCAVAQALWDNQERMGLPKGEFNLRVESYGAFVDARGIVLQHRHSSDPDKAIEDVSIASESDDGSVYGDSLEIWTMQFDEWFDFRTMARVEWREKHGREKGDTACRPSPASFVLDLDAMETEAE